MTRALLIALFAVAALAGCADFEVRFNQPTAEDARPDWLRDPARGEYPYSPKGW